MHSSVYRKITYILQPTWKLEMRKRRRRPRRWIAPATGHFLPILNMNRGKETHTYDTTPALPEFLLLQKKLANPPLYAHGRARDDAIRAATVPAIASLSRLCSVPAISTPENVHRPKISDSGHPLFKGDSWTSRTQTAWTVHRDRKLAIS